MNSNEIEFLNRDFTDQLDHFEKHQLLIDLRSNPFACKCGLDSIHFIKWVRERQSTFAFAKSYKCDVNRKRFGLTEKRLQTEMISICHFNQFELIIYTVLSTIGFVLLIVIAFVMYWKRWKIRYFLFMRLKRRKTSYNKVTKKKYKYDAFISYSAEDRFWVHGVLMKELETVYGFNLCIHYRDFRVGADILEEINEKMNQSREIVVVLSETSVDKYWCEQELKISLALTNQRRQNLIVIKIGNIAPDVESVTANHVLQHRNYLEWTDEMDKDQDRQKLFWARLVAFMYGTTIGNSCFSCCKFSSKNLSDSLDGYTVEQ